LSDPGEFAKSETDKQFDVTADQSVRADGRHNFVVVADAQTEGGMSMARMKMVDTDTVDPELKDVFEKMKQRGTVMNVWRMMAWSPALAKVWAPFARGLRFDLSVSRRLRELLIVQIACQHESKYEYGHHAHMAQAEGVTPAQLAALPRWSDGALFDADESLVLQLADELSLSSGASAATMRALLERFGEKHLMELLATGAFYCAVARIVNSLDCELEPEAQQPHDAARSA
jgi:4-carboxymuconolactone decarboxylase